MIALFDLVHIIAVIGLFHDALFNLVHIIAVIGLFHDSLFDLIVLLLFFCCLFCNLGEAREGTAASWYRSSYDL